MALLCFHIIATGAVYLLHSAIFTSLKKKIQKKFSCMQEVKVILALMGLEGFCGFGLGGYGVWNCSA